MKNEIKLKPRKHVNIENNKASFEMYKVVVNDKDPLISIAETLKEELHEVAIEGHFFKTITITNCVKDFTFKVEIEFEPQV